MHIILASPARLASQYSPAAATRLQRAVDALVAARRQAGIASMQLAPEEGLAPLGLPAADGGDAEAVRAQLAALDAALAARGDGVESVLLVGGPAAVPFHHFPNPVADDDGPIPADFPYGARGPGDLLMDWPVGRLPAADSDPRPLLRLLRLATLRHRAQARGNTAAAAGAFGYSAASWQAAAAAVYAQIDDPAALQISPPVAADSFDRRRLAAARLAYCNLHGVPARPTWYGEALGQRAGLVVAMGPQDLEGLALGGAIFSACCYGAYGPAYDLGSSIAVRAMLQGTTCFVGATALAYGPVAPPLLGADLLAFHFLRAAAEPGARAGQALRRAREQMLVDTLRQQGFLDDDDLKTLLAFVLYGDPTLAL